MKVKGTRWRCLLEECVKDNYYARFRLHSYHCCREMNFISRLDVNFPDLTQNIDNVTGAWNEGQGHRVKVPAWRVCQGQLLCKVSSSQLPLLQRNEVYSQTWRNFLDSTQNIDKVGGAWNEGQVTRSRCLLEGCVKNNYYARFHLHSYHYCREMNFISRLDVNFPDSSQNIDKVTGAWNEGQGHRVKVPAWRVCQGQLLCKVSSSQLSLLQRNEVYSQTRRKFSRLDANCGRTDGRTDGRTNGRTNERTNERTDERTESWTPISHLAKRRCDKNVRYQL